MRKFLPLFGLSLILLGCSTGERPSPRLKPPDSGPTIQRHEAKDRNILAAANEAAEIAPEVRPQVEIIRAAVASAPAAEIKKIVDSYEKIVGELTATNAKLTKRAEEAEDKFSRYVRGGLFTLGALVFAAGIAVAVLGSKVPMFGPVAGVAVSAGGSGIFAMAIVYDFVVKHPYIAISGVAGTFLVAATLFLANVRNERKA